MHFSRQLFKKASVNLSYAPRALRYKVNVTILKDMCVSNLSCLEGKIKASYWHLSFGERRVSGWVSGWMILLFPIESLEHIGGGGWGLLKMVTASCPVATFTFTSARDSLPVTVSRACGREKLGEKHSFPSIAKREPTACLCGPAVFVLSGWRSALLLLGCGVSDGHSE